MRLGVGACVLLLSAAVLVSADEPIVVNEIIDSLLDGVVKNLKETVTNTVAVPDLEKTFKIGFLEGGLVAADGVMGDLSSIKRAGDVLLVRNEDGKSAVFSGPLHMDKLELNFTNFKAFLSKISLSDKLSIHVKKNIAEIKVSVVSGDYCAVTVDELNMESFGGLKAELSKIRWMKFGVDSIATWVVSMFGKQIKEEVQDKLKEVISNQFKPYNLCAYFLSQT